MILPEIKIIFRQLFHQKSHNLINIFGLAISLSVITLLTGYCFSELNIDQNFKNKENIYVVSGKSYLDSSRIVPSSSVLLTDEIKNSKSSYCKNIC
jgi:hypothetical protein